MMTFIENPVVVSLPIADRRRAFDFYREAFGLEAIGELGDDGVPEPLQFPLNDGVRVMLVPTGGFGWTIGEREVAAPDQSECVLALTAANQADVEEIVRRAQAAGAAVVTEPGLQPWGYAGAIADPDGHVWMLRVEPPAA